MARRRPVFDEGAIDKTLGYIASIPSAEVVFDYIEPPENFSEDVKAYALARKAQLEKTNERWVSGLEPAGVAAILRSHGFNDIEDIDFQQLVSRFGRQVQGLAAGKIGSHVVHAKHS
jgi:O-methyltransferase involved in polyketide biosynthesis